VSTVLGKGRIPVITRINLIHRDHYYDHDKLQFIIIKHDI